MENKQKISVVISTLNEEKKLEECLLSVKWADEIIVVDDGSTDKTIQIAEKYATHVYRHKSAGFVEPARNYALNKAKSEWILLLDADERIPESLCDLLKSIASDTENTAHAISIPRKNIIFTKWIRHAGWWPDYQIRFFKKGFVTWPDKIHAKPIVNGEILKLEPEEANALIHFNYESVSQFLKRMDRYTDIEARENLKTKNVTSEKNWNRKPFEEFLSRFFARKGYRDGIHGLLLSTLEAFSMEILLAKVWEANEFKDNSPDQFVKQTYRYYKRMILELEYWFLTVLIEEEKQPGKKTFYWIQRKYTQLKMRII